MARKNKNEVVAEICLYGNRETGAGWLAKGNDGRMLGDGEPRDGRTFTDAVWLACMVLKGDGYDGMAWVYEPKGQLRAKVEIGHPCYYGDLQWEAGTVYVVSAAEIEKHAAK